VTCPSCNVPSRLGDRFRVDRLDECVARQPNDRARSFASPRGWHPPAALTRPVSRRSHGSVRSLAFTKSTRFSFRASKLLSAGTQVITRPPSRSSGPSRDGRRNNLFRCRQAWKKQFNKRSNVNEGTTKSSNRAIERCDEARRVELYRRLMGHIQQGRRGFRPR